MNIIKTQILRGPNYWSNYRKKLIVMKIDLGIYEELPTNLLPQFKENLLHYLPGLKEDFCSLGFAGGFIKRMEEGTWLGHVIEHVALTLQCDAGMDCGFGRTFGTDEYGIYNVIFAYEIEHAGLYAGKTAVNLVSTLAKGKAYPSLEKDMEHLKEICRKESLGPSTQALVNEAKKRKIPYRHHPDSSLITLGYGRNQKKIWAALTAKTSSISVDIAADKEFTKQILTEHFIPVPKGITIESRNELEYAIEKLGYPLVIKPRDGNHGRGVITNISEYKKAVFGFDLAHRISNKLIIERYITGEDYRFLVVNYKVVAVAKRTPALVIGDGKLSIEALIEKANSDPNRGTDHEKSLTMIHVDESTESLLQQQNLNLQSILPKEIILPLKETANLSAGGTATDVTDEVHPGNLFFAERAAKLLGLDICGIDVISKDIKIPLNENQGAIIEVNAGPGLRMHLAPNQGKARNVAEPIINMLYSSSTAAKIPIVAVTGTNGKTTVVRLIAHMARCAYYTTGATTTDGIYLNNKLMHSGDCSGPVSAQTVLYDPDVNFAVLECARGGILRSGLGFDECDISIITNISGDHLGLDDINTLEDLVQVKSVVALSTKKTGYAVLNADDSLTYDIRLNLDCNIALFGLFESPRIKEHCEHGGLAAYLNNGYILVRHGDEKEMLVEVKEIPLTFNGTATSMILNILPAVLAGVISNFSFNKIREALTSFHPTTENIPGRMNLFNFPNCQIMVDYAHNEGAFLELKNYIDTVQCGKKIGVIGAAGDRRSEDLEKIGFYAAHMFDEIIIRHDEDGRGRSNEEITELLVTGISRSELKPYVTIISSETQAIEYLLEKEHSDTFIFCAVENIFEVINLLKKKKALIHINREVCNNAQS